MWKGFIFSSNSDWLLTGDGGCKMTIIIEDMTLGYDEMWDMMRCDILPKSIHPIYLSMSIMFLG